MTDYTRRPPGGGRKLLLVVRFGDNDFHSMWTGILETVFIAYKYAGYSEEFMKDKSRMYATLKELMIGGYMLFQYSFEPSRYGRFKHGEYLEHLRTYFEKFTEDRLLMNDEARAYLESPDMIKYGDNSETFVLDCETECVYVV